jgi:putative alpha-1,2-mannosidase
VLNELYTPADFPGDEDTGAMSAWYILSSLGIFPLCPGASDWTLGAPLFPQAEIAFPGGRRIRIEAHRNRAGKPYQDVLLDGNLHPGSSIQHRDLLKNSSQIVFQTSLQARV